MFAQRPSTLAVILACSILTLLPACESSDGPTDPAPPEPLEVTGTVGISGGTLTSSNGKLSIKFPPGALTGDTRIALREAEPSASDPRLGDFNATTVIEMEPAGLQLQANATISYETDLAVESTSSSLSTEARRGDQKRDDFELALGILLEESSTRIPDQRIRYRTTYRTLRFEFDFDYLDKIYIGPPIGRNKPNAGDELSTLYLGLTLGAPTFVVNEPFVPRLTVETAAPQMWSFGNFELMPPLFSHVWNGETPASAATDVGNGRASYELTPEYTATETGDFGLDLDFTLNMTIPNADLLDLPDDISPTQGSIEVEVETSGLQFRIMACALFPCFEDFIITGMNSVGGMSVNYLGASDADPDSLFTPWLYIAGSEGMQYYRLARKENGEILSATFRGDLGQLGDFTGCVPVSNRDGGAISRGLFVFGDTGGWRSNWNNDPLDPAYGIQLGITFSKVTDAVSYGGLDQVRGYTYCANGSVLSVEYYPPVQFYVGEETLTLTIGNAFEGAIGIPTTALVDPVTNGILVVMDGSPSQVWFHDRVDQFLKGSVVTTVGSDPRRMRGSGSVVAVSNFASNTISILTWAGGSAVTNRGEIPVGTGPFGIDVMPLANGNVAIVSTSETDNTYTFLEVGTDGSLVRSITSALPGECAGAKHAVFLPGAVVYIIFSCQGGEVEFLRTNLAY